MQAYTIKSLNTQLSRLHISAILCMQFTDEHVITPAVYQYSILSLLIVLLIIALNASRKPK